MRSNESLQNDVQNAIKWEPLLNAAEIGVTVKDGIVNLTGTVNSYAKKIGAEDAAKKVAGVKAVVEKIEIEFFSGYGKMTDNEIATEVVNTFRWNSEIPNDKVHVKVEKGWVTLSGEVFWNYQKEVARTVIMNIIGVQGVTNSITIKSETKDEIEKKGIENALLRNWSINSQDIQVKVTGTRVMLKGKVHSWYQKDEAGRIAWNAPGVCSVENDLAIDYSFND
jgi:osmotically-inducible protein OsmY